MGFPDSDASVWRLQSAWPAGYAQRHTNLTRVPDSDLDFFVREVVYNQEPDAARSDRLELSPWSTETALMFLEIHVGLSPERPSRGATVENHKSVFLMWRDLIRSGALLRPLDLVHLDAHADLGLA